MMKAPGLLMLKALAITLVVAALMLWLIPSAGHLWMKALHVVAIISWMAGLLYLPRLFVYHCTAEANAPQSETFKVMERRLLKGIMTPAMVASWAVGLWLAWDLSLFADLWFQLKLFLAAVLTWVHWFLANCVQEFAEDRNQRPQRFYRFINEVPTLVMIGIVILVIVQPF